MYSNIYSQFYIFSCELKNVSVWAPSTTMIEYTEDTTALDGYRKKNRNMNNKRMTCVFDENQIGERYLRIIDKVDKCR